MNLPKLVLASIAAAGAAAVAAGAVVTIAQTPPSSAPPSGKSGKMEWLTKAAPWYPAAATPVKTPCLECGQG